MFTLSYFFLCFCIPSRTMALIYSSFCQLNIVFRPLPIGNSCRFMAWNDSCEKDRPALHFEFIFLNIWMKLEKCALQLAATKQGHRQTNHGEATELLYHYSFLCTHSSPSFHILFFLMMSSISTQSSQRESESLHDWFPWLDMCTGSVSTSPPTWATLWVVCPFPLTRPMGVSPEREPSLSEWNHHIDKHVFKLME